MDSGTFADAAAYVALVLGIVLSLRTLGLFERPVFSLTSNYLAPTNILGQPTVPHFVLDYRNEGNVSVVFSDFEVFLPRLDPLDEEGRFIFQPGADFFIDKRPTMEIGGIQQYSKIDHRTNVVRLGPRESHVDYFDLESLLPDGWDEVGWDSATAFARRFSPILRFRESWGNEYHCDQAGAHFGEYVYPYEDALTRDVPSRSWQHRLAVKRVRAIGWSTDERPHRLARQ